MKAVGHTYAYHAKTGPQAAEVGETHARACVNTPGGDSEISCQGTRAVEMILNRLRPTYIHELTQASHRADKALLHVYLAVGLVLGCTRPAAGEDRRRREGKGE